MASIAGWYYLFVQAALRHCTALPREEGPLRPLPRRTLSNKPQREARPRRGKPWADQRNASSFLIVGYWALGVQIKPREAVSMAVRAPDKGATVVRLWRSAGVEKSGIEDRESSTRDARGGGAGCADEASPDAMLPVGTMQRHPEVRDVGIDAYKGVGACGDRAAASAGRQADSNYMVNGVSPSGQFGRVFASLWVHRTKSEWNHIDERHRFAGFDPGEDAGDAFVDRVIGAEAPVTKAGASPGAVISELTEP